MPSTTVQYAFFLALLVLVTLAFVGLVQAFLLPLFWAATLAIIFHPVYRRVRALLGGRATIAALLTLSMILLVVILPSFFVGLAVVREAAALYQRLESGQINLQEPLQAAERLLPTITTYLEQFGVETERLKQWLASAVVTVSRFVGTQALSIGQDTLRLTVLFFIMLYLLFFFLRDGEQIVATLIRVLPLGERRERLLLSKFATVTRATIKGSLVVGVVQGTLGGLLFAALGINAAVFWGVMMTVLSLLPAVGSGFIWGPAAVILFATGHVVKALILFGGGILVIGLVDNLLRPVLIGRDTSMPDYLVLLSTLGGLTMFGISGFVIGPVIAALFLAVWDMFALEHGDDNTAGVIEAKEPQPTRETAD
jgi:predicted PurR-regulated permease PerM